MVGHQLPKLRMRVRFPSPAPPSPPHPACVATIGRQCGSGYGKQPRFRHDFVKFVHYDLSQDSLSTLTMLRNILVIEDNPDICDLVSLHLRDLGYRVEVQMNGEKGLLRAVSGHFQLVILDLMLPGMNGLEICTKLRADYPYIPILMLTAKSTEVDRIVGLESGPTTTLPSHSASTSC